MIRKGIYFSILLFSSLVSFSQTDSNTVISFDFNEQQFKETNNQLTIKAVGVTLTEDRFGNQRSAAYVHGNATSYLNLGTSNLLKPKKGTISMWVNLQSVILAGKGYAGNPFLIIKNGPGEDFIIGCGLNYNPVADRFGAQASKDSLKEVGITSKDTVILITWYHLAVSYDNDYFAFYVNGELQGRLIKGFETSFLEGDSVILGRTTGNKNIRFTQAILDDIRFYHRVLSDKEINDLYHEPNPNRFKNIMAEVLKYGIVVIFLGIIILIILIQNKRKLKKQKEYYELNNKIKELEIKVIKNQMNPHFISNSLAAIQNLIYTNETEKAGQYLAKFSYFLRQVLNHSDKTYISLKEELNLIKLNVELEQLRFKNNFTFDVKADENIDLEEVMIPSLITQPFIENAIWHGLLPLETRDPHLRVLIYLKDDIVFVEIKDNGVGRANPQLLPGKNSKGTRLAMDKMESTNQLRNSSDYKLEIIDVFDKEQIPGGTKIIIQLLNSYSEE